MNEETSVTPTPSDDGSPIVRFFQALGPAIVVASVVLGPGSILTSSRVGAGFGFSMVWLPLMAAALMMGMTALAARLGVVYEGTICDELTARVGRPVAVLVGLTIFLVCAGFQFSNNVGVLAALEPWLSENQQFAGMPVGNWILIGLNGVIIACLFGLRQLYQPVEKLMMILVGLMIAGFVGNLVFLLALGTEPAGEVVSTNAPDVRAVFGLLATTFSVAGAFYQAYLVREKGWTIGQVREGTIDSVAGITVLGSITLVIMATAALSFAGRNVQLDSVTDVAAQLQHLFGRYALILFSMGLFAGAFSSFLVNAMIGGTVLSDGLGLGAKMDSLPVKIWTTVALLTGMCVALFVPGRPVNLVIFAQAMVVIGFPLLALSLVYLAFQKELAGPRRIPTILSASAVLGLVVVFAAAVNLGWGLVLTLWE